MPTLKQKIVKELALPERGSKNNETVTRVINNLAESTKFKVCIF